MDDKHLHEGAIEAFITYKLLQLLSTPWEEQEAFELGIIDDSGKPLKKFKDLNTKKEREAYSILHRLVFGLKRLMSKLPLLRTKLGTYAAALMLIKENYGDEVDAHELEANFIKYMKDNDIYLPLEEALLEEGEVLKKGKYRLASDVMDIEGNVVKKGTKININKDIKKTEKLLGKNVFMVKLKGNSMIAVSLDDIKGA